MSSILNASFTAAALLFASALEAQTPYYRSIGNRWLGGALYAAAGYSTTNTLTTRSAAASLQIGADVNILTYTRAAADVRLSASNTLTGSWRYPTQSASASFRLQLAGYTVWNRSVSTTGDLGGISPRTYNLFPVSPRVSVPVGPFSVTLSGNAGVTLGGGAMVVLPATSVEARLLASGTTSVIARAAVAVGVAGFGAGIELNGRFAETRLTAGIVASLSGLSGSCSFEVQAIRLRLVAFLTALYQRVYSTTLTSWGSGWVSRNLLL